MAFGVLILFLLIGVAISRWVFRINDIVKNLESINAKLNGLTGEHTKHQTGGNPKPSTAVSPDMPCLKCGYKPMKVITKVDGSTGIECPACRSFYPAS